MIEEVNTNPIRDFLETSSRQPGSAGPLPNDDEDVSVQVDYASLIDQAMQTPQTDTQTIQRALELLLSGELESQEYITEASENIVTFGI